MSTPEGGEGEGEGVCEVASALVVNLMCRFTSPKPPYIELPFYFPKVSFCFLELPFGFPKMLVYFSKMPYHFPELPLSFPEFPSIYLLCMSFFKNAFLSWLYLLILLRAGQSDKIYLALVFFLIGTLCWPTYAFFVALNLYMEYDFLCILFKF